MQLSSYAQLTKNAHPQIGFLETVKDTMNDFTATSVDKALMQLEVALFTQYAWDRYPKTLLDENTIFEDNEDILGKFYESEADTVDSQGKSRRPNRKKVARPLRYRGQAGQEMRKVHDVLAMVEFFVNRFNSINDEEIKESLVVARKYLSNVARDAVKLGSFAKKVFDPPAKMKKISPDFYGLIMSCASLAPPAPSATRYDRQGFTDMFVHLEKGTDLDDRYREFWKSVNLKLGDQLEASEEYLPLGELAGLIMSDLDSIPADSPFCYTI